MTANLDNRGFYVGRRSLRRVSLSGEWVSRLIAESNPVHRSMLRYDQAPGSWRIPFSSSDLMRPWRWFSWFVQVFLTQRLPVRFFNRLGGGKDKHSVQVPLRGSLVAGILIRFWSCGSLALALSLYFTLIFFIFVILLYICSNFFSTTS